MQLVLDSGFVFTGLFEPSGSRISFVLAVCGGRFLINGLVRLTFCGRATFVHDLHSERHVVASRSLDMVVLHEVVVVLGELNPVRELGVLSITLTSKIVERIGVRINIDKKSGVNNVKVVGTKPELAVVIAVHLEAVVGGDRGHEPGSVLGSDIVSNTIEGLGLCGHLGRNNLSVQELIGAVASVSHSVASDLGLVNDRGGFLLVDLASELGI
mmetsp:Transcript_20896/g.32312  ORF Transcript_20896/g.32312 Transcript_20896/m.32312 type:complete len:213 (+) Transcript_20896:1738-2376(+)